MCFSKILENNELLGGEGYVVEIDECLRRRVVVNLNPFIPPMNRI
jgi:hypothetical protein